jgi:dolichyl-diphosphooligosaccharide--protein glycosyltransferase
MTAPQMAAPPGAERGGAARAARGWGAPLALSALAFALRALPWPSVFEAGRVVFPENDSYYHARRILYTVVRFPEVLHLDPYLNFPHGGEPIWPPLFDFAIAVLARLTVGADEAAFERLLAWIPPVLGAATAALACAGARVHFGRAAGWIAGTLVAVLPAHMAYSRVGFLDHHVGVSLLGAVLLFAGMGLLRAGARGPIPLRPALALSLACGTLVAAALLLWPGMILEVALFDAGCLGLLLTRSRAADLRAVALLGALAHGLAALVVAPFAWGNVWRVWGSFTPVVLTSFQPWLLAGVAAFFGAVALAALRARGHVAPGRRAALVLACGLAVGGAAVLAVPDLEAPWRDVWRWFAKEERFQATVAESRPLLFYTPGRLGLGLATSQLSLLFFLLPFLLAAAAWRLRRAPARPAAALLVAWTATFLAASLVQIRFAHSLAVPFAVLVAWTGPALVRALARRVRLGGRAAALAGVAGLALLLAPALGAYRPYLRNHVRALEGLAPQRGGREERKRLLLEVSDWLRAHTEPTAGWLDAGRRPEYAVLSHWTDGHILQYVARRPTVVDNFGDDLGEENFALSEEYYVAPEPRASGILDALGARYVLFEYRPLPGRSEVAARTVLSRLYFADGEASDQGVVARARRARRVELEVSAVERHRLVFEARDKPYGKRRVPAFKVYEHVRGALLSGAATPGGEVEARLAVTTNQGRGFEFVSRTRADAAGRFALRFPYSTQGTPPSVQTAPEVELRGAAGASRVVVRERDVQEGLVVEVPPFAPLSAPDG